MSTYHILLKRDDVVVPACEGASPSLSPAVEVALDERSQKFDLHVGSGMFYPAPFTDREKGIVVVDGLTFADLRVIRDRIDSLLDGFGEKS